MKTASKIFTITGILIFNTLSAVAGTAESICLKALVNSEVRAKLRAPIQCDEISTGNKSSIFMSLSQAIFEAKNEVLSRSENLMKAKELLRLQTEVDFVILSKNQKQQEQFNQSICENIKSGLEQTKKEYFLARTELAKNQAGYAYQNLERAAKNCR